MSRWSHTSLFYVYTLLWRLQFTNALWILYLIHLGWPLWQIGVAEAAFHAVALASELPTGAFADRFGKKTSLSVGLLIGCLTTWGMYLLPRAGFVPGVLGVGASSLSWAFTGGADRALLYEVAESSPEGSDAYAHLYGRALAITLAAGAVASAAGGFLVSLGWIWPFALSALPLLMAVLPVSLLPSPRHAASDERPPLLAVMREGVASVRQNHSLGLVVGFGALLALLVTTNHLYAQSTLSLKGAPVVLVTVLIGVMNALGALGSLLAGRARRHAGIVLAGGGLAMAVGLAVFGFAPLLAAVLAFSLVSLADGIVSPVYDAAMNDLAPPAVRATVLSFENALFSLSMIVFFPVAGWAMGQTGTAIPYFVMGSGRRGAGPPWADDRSGGAAPGAEPGWRRDPPRLPIAASQVSIPARTAMDANRDAPGGRRECEVSGWVG